MHKQMHVHHAQQTPTQPTKHTHPRNQPSTRTHTTTPTHTTIPITDMATTIKCSLLQYLRDETNYHSRYPSVMLYKADGRIMQTTKSQYLEELRPLKGAHPSVDREEIDNGKHTHTLMTGGKFLFNEEPIPDWIGFSHEFSDLHQDFRAYMLRTGGRKETYADMLWLMLNHVSLNPDRWHQDACLTECISQPYHRFFLDLHPSIVGPHTTKDWTSFIRKICNIAGKAVLICYREVVNQQQGPAENFEFSVLCTKGDWSKKLSDNLTVYKLGIRLVWPGLIVNRDIAQLLACYIEECLTRDLPRNVQGGENAWKDVIDLSVYSSGVRSPGSPKITPCAVCRKYAPEIPAGIYSNMSTKVLEQAMCHPPNGFLSHGVESVYSLFMIARADGAFSRRRFEERTDAYKMKDTVTGKEYDLSIKHFTSIRTILLEVTPGFTPPLHLQGPFSIYFSGLNVHVKQNPETGDYIEHPRRKFIDFKPKNSHLLVLETSQMNHMTRILRQRFRSPTYSKIFLDDKVWAFDNVDNTKMLTPIPGRAPRKALYTHLLFTAKGGMSHYCHHKGGHHGSNAIRFVVDYLGNIAQGCWSNKTYHGKKCSKQTTKYKDGFDYNMGPANNELLWHIFRTQRS